MNLTIMPMTIEMEMIANIRPATFKFAIVCLQPLEVVDSVL